MQAISSVLTVLYFCVLFDRRSTATNATANTTTSEREILEVKEDLSRVWAAIAKLQQQVRSALKTVDDGEALANITKILELQPDGEGNFFKVAHVSPMMVQLDNAVLDTNRTASAVIYQVSTTKSNYVWQKFVESFGFAFWNLGSTTVFHLFHSDGHYEMKRLGDALKDSGAMPMMVIPPETWYVTEVDPVYGSFVLESKLMAPGWTANHYVRGKQEKIEEMFPQHRRIFEKFHKGNAENLNEVD